MSCNKFGKKLIRYKFIDLVIIICTVDRAGNTHYIRKIGFSSSLGLHFKYM